MRNVILTVAAIIGAGALYLLWAETAPYEINENGACIEVNPNLFTSDERRDCP